MPNRERRKYSYTPLAEAVMRVGQKVNFYGVVAEYEQPKPTRGRDLLCTMTVIDMSYNSPGLRVLFFAPEVDMMPRVRDLGDVIRFHRVQMKSHLGAPQANGNPNMGSSFAVLRGCEGGDYVPYHDSSRSGCTMEASDRNIVGLLRTWASTHPIDTLAGTSKYMKQIKDVNVDSYFDVCCKILFVSEQGAENSAVMYVWDGTDASPACLDPSDQGESGDPGQDLWSAKQLAVPVDVMRGFPALGTVLPLDPSCMAEDDFGPQLPVAGDWVKLRNIGCRVRKGLYEGVLHRGSKIGILSPSAQAVQNCERAYEERLASDALRLPQWCPQPPQSMLVTGYDHVKLSALREVLTYPEATYKFRCMVRVMATRPSDVLDFCVPKDDGAAQPRVHPEQGEFVFAVRLTLEDPTARLHAFLYGEDAVEFFAGCPAANLRQQGHTVGVLKRKVDRLLGVTERGPRNPPWVTCCLKSYYLDKDHPRETRRYRVFGTRFPG
ncbi:hypothetical protein KC19_8G001300 [Ceratodon purpureus]|uniref:Telomeric single stranded DNA binding POT1/Cdc13 domain-containing protein n=1 Tax=Ceratodon purpureus TaxID=3225 RepID=A0A8T0GVJ6_CERPU|nr:hypothetical protein KC19_N031400 [Ceratodon purpureus]KAG0504517.1 hypothetical protein KC19_N025400 [Ceratodon purpureus]KAG0563050.1 hypothetical protein KC19_8G000800 [Ceratodon purpureus]KAG0563055.1 hypothetical protein KC19_8G001300 [Ceratodon purpureus]